MNLDSDFIEPIQKWVDTYVKGGFVEKEISFFENNEAYSFKKWEFANFQKKAFERILRRFIKLKVNVVLVQAPITKELYDSHLDSLLYKF